MPLTILGAHAGDVWIDVEGDPVCLNATDLANLRTLTARFPKAECDGVWFDESDVIELIKALTGPQLDDCTDCDGPGLVVIDGRPLCMGHVAGYGAAEEAS